MGIAIEKSLRGCVESIEQKHGDGDEISFEVIDLGEIYRQHLRWKANLPRIQPYYAVKCNRDSVVCQFLASLGVGFNCSSKQDVQRLLALKHSPARITYTHPYKTKAFLKYAAQHDVKRLAVESTEELLLVQEHHPKAELFLRLATFQSLSGGTHQSEFGLHPAKSLDFLMAAKASLLDVVGVAFHVEADGSNPAIFQKAMLQAVEDSRAVFQQATELGFAMNQLDVGGGFRGQNFEEIALTLNKALDEHFLTGCEILAEPGRFYVSSAITKACKVIGKRYVPTPSGEPCHMLYLNDSIYDNFSNIIHDTKTLTPHILEGTSGRSKISTNPGNIPHKYTVCGATTNVGDRMCDDCYLPRALDIGDWLYFPNMGAYSRSTSSHLNSDSSTDHDVHYICSEKEARLVTDPLIALSNLQ
ncbi:pyridoxal-dependent decarboxylase [Usnea florida]